MKSYGLVLTDGAQITNLNVESGIAFPMDDLTPGQIFFRIDEDRMYFLASDLITWEQMGGDAVVEGIDILSTGIATDDQMLVTTGSGGFKYASVPEGGSGSTNLGIILRGFNLDITSSSGDNITVPAATDTDAGVMTSANKIKLGTIATGAQVNLPFGIEAGEVAEGNDSRILNGESAYGWGDHSEAGYLVDITGELLGELLDVDVPIAPVGGQVLTYDDGVSPGMWVAATPSIGVTDHTLLSNIGTNTHAQIDTHVADDTVHFTQAEIDITESQISDLQSYLLDITGESIADLSDVQTAMSPVDGQVLTYSGSEWQSETPASGVTDHTLLSNIGTNTHAQIDNHIADDTVHFTEASISITESQISDLQSYLLDITGESIADLSDVLTSMVPTDGQVLTYDDTNGWQAETASSGVTDHTLLSNIGTNTHAQIDTHIGDDTVHFTQAEIDITKTQINDFSDADYATASDGALAQSAVQPGDLGDAGTRDVGLLVTDVAAGNRPAAVITDHKSEAEPHPVLGAVIDWGMTEGTIGGTTPNMTWDWVTGHIVEYTQSEDTTFTMTSTRPLCEARMYLDMGGFTPTFAMDGLTLYGPDGALDWGDLTGTYMVSFTKIGTKLYVMNQKMGAI